MFVGAIKTSPASPLLTRQADWPGQKSTILCRRASGEKQSSLTRRGSIWMSPTAQRVSLQASACPENFFWRPRWEWESNGVVGHLLARENAIQTLKSI